MIKFMPKRYPSEGKKKKKNQKGKERNPIGYLDENIKLCFFKK